MTRIIGLFSLSHEQNKARFNYAVARKQRRSQFRRMLNGCFFSSYARNLMWKSVLKNGLWPEIIMDPRKTRRARNYIRV